MTANDDQFTQLWSEAIESHIRALPEDQLRPLLDKARGTTDLNTFYTPPVHINEQDPGDRQRAILQSIARKQAQSAARGPADCNGYRPGGANGPAPR